PQENQQGVQPSQSNTQQAPSNQEGTPIQGQQNIQQGQ
ncbi:hypothetical protein A5875_000762, partial [Enterococcus sp. 3H8_DIV0648]